MVTSRRTTLSLRAVALVYLTALLLLPVAVVFWRTFEHGFGTAWSFMTTPAAVSALWLTILLAAIAVPLNAIFGVGAAMVLVRGKAPRAGKAILDEIGCTGMLMWSTDLEYDPKYLQTLNALGPFQILSMRRLPQ